MRIRRPRGLTGAQIGIATVIGILGGVYIWRPYFVEDKSFIKKSELKKEDLKD